MSVLSRPYFYDEAAAFEHVESILWPQGPVCHHCGSMEKPYKLAGVRTKASKKNPHGVERHGLYKCSDCRQQFTVRMGTIFEESHLPLHKWLQAIHLMVLVKEGHFRASAAPRSGMHLQDRMVPCRIVSAKRCVRMTSPPWAALASSWKSMKPTLAVWRVA
jgi:hypothetical protein